MKKTTVYLYAVTLLVVAAAFVLYVVKPFGDGGDGSGYTVYTPGDYFVTNVKDSGYWLKMNVVLVLDTDELNEALSEQWYVVRDTVIFIMRDLSVDEIRSQGVKDILRERICGELNERFGVTNFVDIEITDFVMQ